MAKFNNEYDYIFHLLSSVLKGTQPEEKPESLDWQKIFHICKRHCVENMAFYAVEKLENGPESELKKKWSDKRDRGIIRDFTQLHEFNMATAEFAKEGIRYLALKGVYLKDLYPQRDMRSMSDIDILVDVENLPKVNDILVNMGYTVRVEEDEDHDNYSKKPYTIIEVHRSLFSHGGERFHDLFAEPWAIAAEQEPYSWNFDKNWFFIYLFSHLAKHYQSAGTGIRSIMDIWVYLRAYENELNFDFIYKQLDKVNGIQLCKDIIQLSKIWFDGEKSSDKFDNMANYVLDCGVFGKRLNISYNNIRKMGKFRFMLFRVFPPLSVMKPMYPILKKAPILLPFAWIHRGFVCLIFKRKNITKELNYINNDKQI